MDNYKELKVIGRGNYGSAHLVRNITTRMKFVIKKVAVGLLQPHEQQQAKQEVDLLKGLHHSHIVKYHDHFMHDDILHTVMEYCAGGYVITAHAADLIVAIWWLLSLTNCSVAEISLRT